jgi:capsular exopolysaccharide synthesis family protein
MQQFPDSPDHDADKLPAPSERGRVSALSLARRNQQMSLDLRTVPAESGEDEDEFNLLDYWRILVKRKWTVLAVAALVLVIGFVATLMTTPIYRSTAVIQLERSNLQVVQVGGINAEGSANYNFDSSFQQTQIELLKSRALAERVVSKMGLARSGELDSLWPGSAWANLLSMVRGQPDRADAQPAAGSGKAGEASKQQIAGIAAAFRSGLSVDPVRDSELVRVNYDSPDPKFSQRAANAIAEVFVGQNLERRFDSTSYAKGYLEDRLQELKLKLEDSERKLVEFAQKEQIVSAGGDSGANLIEQNLGSLNAAYAKAKEDRIRAEARWRQAPTLHGTGLQNAVENPMIKTLQESRAKLLLDYQDKLRLYKPDYPVMQQLRSQIDEIEKQIHGEEGNIRSGIQADYQAALQQEQMLATQLNGLKGDVLDLQKRSIQYNILKRDVDTNRQLYDALLQRYKEIGIASGVSANNISLVDRAEPGFQFKPDMKRNLTMSLLGGLLLGVLLALAFEYLDDTIKRPDDIEKLLGVPLLGAIPMLKAPMTPASAMEDARSAFAEAYRSLRTALQFSTDRGVPRTLLVTSATPSEGKSTTAHALGRLFAELGKRVLIVDCDLRNPSLHRAFGVDNDQGLSNYLAGSVKPTDLIRSTSLPGLMYLPTGPLPPNPAELLVGSKMVSLLTVAVEKFDVLILDGPPIMGLADAPILSNLAHGTLLVVQAGETRVAVVRNAIKRLHAARAHIVGGLLTHFQPQHAGQGYGYGYGGYDYYSYGTSRPRLTSK